MGREETPNAPKLSDRAGSTPSAVVQKPPRCGHLEGLGGLMIENPKDGNRRLQLHLEFIAIGHAEQHLTTRAWLAKLIAFLSLNEI
jgi:hypothetical protein